jgi:hypothetical protein
MTVRVVLYTEGAAEHGGDIRLLPAPREALAEVHLGPAHLLVRRIVAAQKPCPDDAVRFISPLRIGRGGRIARGSDLHVAANLRELLAFPMSEKRPDLGIVLVDEDGVRGRRDLRGELENSRVPAAFGLATPEFEAWLIADHASLCEALNMSFDPPTMPENMAPGVAKAYLADLFTRAGVSDAQRETVRRDLASNCNLETLRRVRGFEELAKDIARILAR